MNRMDDGRSVLFVPEGTDYVSGGHFLSNLILFGRLCKALGMPITPDRIIDTAHALQWIKIGRRGDAYETMRALFVTRQRDLPLFDEAFRAFWHVQAEGWTTLDLQSLGEVRRQRKTQFLPPPDAEPDDAPDGTLPNPDPNLIAIVPTYSQQEILRSKDFAEMSGQEIVQARQMLERMRWSLGTRKARRLVSGAGKSLDMRKVYRESMHYGGEVLMLPTRTPKIKPRPLVLLCDISGSMERYTRLLLHFMHTLGQSNYQIEAFVFATRLSRITRQLRHKSIDRTLKEVGANVKDWGGGTRIGDIVHDFNFHWTRRVLGRGAVVLLITDGWDRGDPDLLRAEMMRLQRNTYRLIWLNPLLGAPQYEPLTRGAQALLPYVDDFRPIRNLSNLESLSQTLSNIEWRRPARAAHLVKH